MYILSLYSSIQYCSQCSGVDDVKNENQRLRDELNGMKEKLKVMEKRSALEYEVYKDGQEKQTKIVEKLQTKVCHLVRIS